MQFDWSAHQDKVWEFYYIVIAYFRFFDFALIISAFFLVTFSLWFVARFLYTLGFIDVRPNLAERIYMASTNFEPPASGGARPFMDGEIVYHPDGGGGRPLPPGDDGQLYEGEIDFKKRGLY